MAQEAENNRLDGVVRVEVILHQIYLIRIHHMRAVLYTARHDLPDSVRLIRSPNVTNCHMVGPVDSAGFRWNK